MIEIENLCVERNGKLIINDFSATLKAGTITAIVGANGSGKSTLLSAVAGDLPYAGSIRMSDKEVRELTIQQQSELRSVVAQSRHFWLGFTVHDVLSMGMSAEVLEHLNPYAQELKIHTLLNKPVTALSGGEVQRIDIARSLMVDCEVLLFDEPLSAQDINSRQRIIDILLREKAVGKTIAIVAHLDSADLGWCDQLINLSK